MIINTINNIINNNNNNNNGRKEKLGKKNGNDKKGEMNVRHISVL